MTCGSVFISVLVKRTFELGGHIIIRICRNSIPNLYIHESTTYNTPIRSAISVELSRFVNWGLSNVTCDKSRHFAECMNADDIVGAYILSCHLVSHMKTTTSTCTVVSSGGSTASLR